MLNADPSLALSILDESKQTILHLAAKRGNIKLMNLILQYNRYVD
jgi:ankyrin repeat protein